MIAYKHYLPILKCKTGDLWSLRNLKQGSAAWITPLIEMVPPSENKTELQKLQQAVNALEKSWGTVRPLFADLLWRQNALTLPNGNHVVIEFFNMARAVPLRVTPVTSPDRDQAYQQAVRQVLQQDARGLALRLPMRLFGNLDTLSNALDALLRFMGLEQKNQVDLIVDFESVVGMPAGILGQMMRAALSVIPDLAAWRTLAVASGSFPVNLQLLSQGTWNRIIRTEWVAWRSLVTGTNPPHRLPTYSDYAIGDPALPFSGPAKFGANLRYSVGDEFFVWRGYPIGSHPLGNGQMFGICSDLVTRPEYAGPNFSEADFVIQQKSATIGSPGAPGPWRQWGTNHYFELVVSQLASLP